MIRRLHTFAHLWLAASLLCTAASPAHADGAGFVGGFDDLPLADGLTEIAGAGVVFDTPEGRIVERYASGTAEAATVADFYTETLPALGWQPLAPMVFGRDAEALTITVFPPDTDNRLTVRYSLAPR
jgi:hypothetical protein